MTTAQTVRLGPVEQVPPGQGLCFVVGGREIAVFRMRDGRLFAAQNRCPHREGPLADGLAGDGRVICPFHAWAFDLASGKGPSGACLTTYAVRAVEGQLVLEIEGAP